MTTVFGVIALVASALLAWMFARAGWAQMASPLEDLARSGREWVYAIPGPALRLLGALQCGGALVLVIAPAASLASPGNGWSGPLGSLTALSFCVLMVAAAFFHARRGELRSTWTTHLALGSLAVFSAMSQWVTSVQGVSS